MPVESESGKRIVLYPATGPAVSTAILAAGLAWGAMTVVAAMAGWPAAGPRLRAIVDAWAATPGWSRTGILQQLGSVAAVAGLTLGAMTMALGAGRVTAALVSARPVSLALLMPLGLGAISVAVAGMGLAGLLSPVLLHLLALTMFALGIRAARDHRVSFTHLRRSFAGEPVSVVATLLVVAGLWLLLVSLPDTLEDPLVYHWAAPEHFLRQLRLVGAPWLFQWHYPLGVEMLYTLALSLGGIVGIKAVNLAMLITGLVALHALARRLGTGGWTAVVLISLSPAIAEQVWLAKNDLGGLLFWTAALLVPLELSIRSLPGAVLAGALTGLCVSVKYTSIFPLAGLLVWMLLRRPGRRGLAVLTSMAMAIPAVWFARNWLETGNPTFPYASGWLGGPWWGPEYEQAVHDSIAQVTTSPNDQSFYWLLAWRDVLADHVTLGSALAALAPLGLTAMLPPAGRAICAASILAFLAVLAERNTRFLLPLMSLTATGGAMAIDALRTRWPRPCAWLWPVLLAAATVNLGVRALTILAPEDWCSLAGRMTRTELLTARYTCLDELRGWCAARLPADARILLTGSHARFGFRQSVFSTHVVTCPMPWRWAKESRTPDELAKKWRQAGINYVADNLISARYRHQLWFQGPAWDDRMLRIYRVFVLRYVTEVYRSPHLDFSNGMFYLLRVDQQPHAPARSTPVLPWTESFFVRANALGSRGVLRNEALRLAREALARCPDVDDVIEQTATIFHRLGDYPQAIKLNRMLARDGFDGESGWYELAAEESYFGNRREAFAALRRRSMLTPSSRSDTDALVGMLFFNWANQRARAGDAAGACHLLAISLHASPGYEPARAAATQLACGHGHTAPEGGKDGARQ